MPFTQSFHKLIVVVAIATGLSLAFTTIAQSPAHALNGSEFQPGRIIDDSVFYNSSSMTVTQIQEFLNSKLPTCDTNGTKMYNSTQTRAQWAAANSRPLPPYVCLKNFSQTIPGVVNSGSNLCKNSVSAGTKSAAQLIYDAGVACGINPQVLLVMLQKEQSLITDDWPWPTQYDKAMGYACPDSGPNNSANCDSAYFGFFNQVYNAAMAFRRYEANPNSYNYKANRNNNILYNPNTGCGSSTVFIQNQATASLYIYTPYQPNQAALNNLYGSGDSCSAYGNRNFWRMFNDWFGSTVGSNYAWRIESFIYSGGDNVLNVGATETMTLRAKNIGVVPWYNHGNNPVRLATWEPAERQSELFKTHRLTTLQESVVLPGEIGTFTFQVSPQTPGTFYESLNLVSENNAYAEWPGFRPTIIVSKPYEWSLVNVMYEKGTGLMDPGTTQLITVIARNTGSATWTKSNGVPIRIGTWQPTRQSSVGSNWLSTTRAVEMNESQVSPGQTAGFQFYVRMPASGTFYEKLNLVAEGQSWFNDNGLTLYLQGNDFKWSLEDVSYSNGTGVTTIGSTQTVTVRARNTGSATWQKNGDFPIKLGTWQPARQSMVSQNWPNPTRMATLAENQVAPGQIGTFTAQVTIPTPGTHYERMNLVAEGLKWFNDANLTLYLEGR